MSDKKKPAMALVISVGPKMPKKPIDTATPDKMKKYGSMKKAWGVLKENMEVAVCKDCSGEGKIPFNQRLARGVFDPNPEAGQIGDPCPSCGGSGNAPISDPAFAAMQQKLTGEPMNLAFRLIKAPNLPDAHSSELYDKLMSLQQPSKPNLMNRRDAPPPPNFYEEQKAALAPSPSPPVPPVPPVPNIYARQPNIPPTTIQQKLKLTGEPMDLAFRLLKESIDPKKLAEMRAARDAARRQMGQPNPDRGGDVEPI